MWHVPLKTDEHTCTIPPQKNWYIQREFHIKRSCIGKLSHGKHVSCYFVFIFFQLIICFHFEHQSNTCYNKLFKMQIVCMKIAIQNVWLKLIAIIACFYNIYTWCHCILSGHFLNNRKLNKYISFLHWNKIKQKPTNGEEKKPYQWF